MHCLCPLKTWAVCRFGRFPIRPGALACSTSISVGRTCFNMAWVSGGALWLAARSTGKIGNEMRAYVCWGCEIVQTCVWIIAQQLCAMQQINVALCQATANISASLVCVSLTVFFFSPSPSSCSFCLALLMLCIHITVQHENANYIFKTPVTLLLIWL